MNKQIKQQKREPQATQIEIPIPWKEFKTKIEEYKTNLWSHAWETDPQFKHTKLFYAKPNKKKSKPVMKTGTYKLGAWIKGITGHNNLAHFQSKPHSEIDPTYRLGMQSNKTLHHIMTDCEATAFLQLDNKTPWPDMPCEIKKHFSTTPKNLPTNGI